MDSTEEYSCYQCLVSFTLILSETQTPGRSMFLIQVVNDRNGSYRSIVMSWYISAEGRHVLVHNYRYGYHDTATNQHGDTHNCTEDRPSKNRWLFHDLVCNFVDNVRTDRAIVVLSDGYP